MILGFIDYCTKNVRTLRDYLLLLESLHRHGGGCSNRQKMRRLLFEIICHPLNENIRSRCFFPFFTGKYYIELPCISLVARM